MKTRSIRNLSWRSALEVVSGVAMLVSAVIMGAVGIRTLLTTSGPRVSTSTPVDAPLPKAPIPLAGVPTKGSAAAPAALIVHTDFECPYCARFATEILPEIERRYVSSNRLLIALRHFPIEKVHPSAVLAAEATECAGQQRQFWPMHDELFRGPRRVTRAEVTSKAGQLGLDRDAFATCLAAGSARVREDLANSLEIGVRVTPTVFLGRMLQDGSVQAEKRITGLPTIEALARAVDELLESISARPLQ